MKQFYIHTTISGGISGHRKSTIKQNGKTQMFQSAVEASAKITDLKERTFLPAVHVTYEIRYQE